MEFLNTFHLEMKSLMQCYVDILLRDAINLRIAISEIHRVLKKDGRFVIVDLGKPDEDSSEQEFHFISDAFSNFAFMCRW